MPVEKKNKTNFDYLRDILVAHLPEVNREEAMEFVEAIENDLSDAKDELKSKDGEIESQQSEIQSLEEEKEYEDSIDTCMSSKDNIRWSAGNLACKSMMEELNNAIARGIPVVRIENILRVL